MKRKSEGLSLLIVLVLCFAAMGAAVAVFDGLARSLEQSYAVQRGLQMFYAAESGVEAGIFHHNARGPGVNLSANTTITHPSVGSQTTWGVTGRAVFAGPVLIPENATVEIPLSYDAAADTEAAPSTAGINAYTLELSSDAASGFDFGTSTNDVAVDWSLSRETASGVVQTLRPEADDPSAVCASSGTNRFACKDNLAGGSFVLDNSITMVGIPYQSVGGPPDTFHNIASPPNKPKIRFTQLLGNTDTTGVVIAGVNYMITNTAGEAFPTDTYTVESSVADGRYGRTLSATIREGVAPSLLDVLIIE